MVGLGARRVSSEVAAGRALRHLLNKGDTVAADAVEGTIVAVHPTAVELITPAGTTMLVPNSTFVESSLTVTRRPD